MDIYDLIREDHCGFVYDPIQGRLFKIEEVRIVHEDNDGKVHGDRRFFNGVSRLCTHIIYYIMTGNWPIGVIDHKNGCGWDNSWENLREATKAQNNHNRQSGRASPEGMDLGVEKTPAGNYRVKVKGRHIGTFASVEEANAASITTRKAEYGEFAFHNRNQTEES